MGWENWIIGISVGVIAIAIVILVIFLIRVLLELRCSLAQTHEILRNTNEIAMDVEKKLHSFDPLFKTVSRIGCTVEKASVKHLSEEAMDELVEEKKEKVERITQTLLEVVEWGLIGVALWKKFKKR